MDYETALTELAARLRSFFADTGDPHLSEALDHWPGEARAAGQVEPSNLPVVRLLERGCEPASGDGAKLLDALKTAASLLSWRQTYTMDDFPQDFLDRYGWTIVVGPQAPVVCDHLLAGFLLLGPGIEYPRHHHSPEEFYRIVSGQSEWSLGEEDWEPRAPGDLIHNPPWQWHAMRVGPDAPLLLAFIFMAEAVEKSNFD